MGGCQSSICTKDGKMVLKYQLNITTRTTTKSYNFLFDANDPTTIIKQSFKLSEPGFLIRNDTEVTFIRKDNEKNSIPVGAEKILDIKLKNDHLSLNKPIVPKTTEGVNIEIEKQMLEMPWIVAKQPANKKEWKGLKIKKGDVIRFGRIKFRIKAKNPLILDNKGKSNNPDETISEASSIEEAVDNSDIVGNSRHDDGNANGVDKRGSLENGVQVQQVGVQVQQVGVQVHVSENHEEMLPERMGESLGRGRGKSIIGDKDLEKGEEEIEPAEIVNQKPEGLNFDNANNPNASMLDSENKACRICLWDDEEPGDPIIQPCKCSGTMKNVHINCFKSWIGKKVDRKESSSMISVFWKRLQCEICHTEVSRKPFRLDDTTWENFLDSIEWKGNFYNLVDVPVVPPPNLVLEYFHNERVLGFHIVKFGLLETKKIFGRGSHCEIRVHDNTVSRIHAQISHVNRQFYLKDLESKYGTFLLLDETRNLVKSNNQFSLQVGRTVIDCQVTKIKSFVANGKRPARIHPLMNQATNRRSTDSLSSKSNSNNSQKRLEQLGWREDSRNSEAHHQVQNNNRLLNLEEERKEQF